MNLLLAIVRMFVTWNGGIFVGNSIRIRFRHSKSAIMFEKFTCTVG